MKRTTHIILFAAIGSGLALLAGCQCPPKPVSSAYSPPPMKHLIFDANPGLSADGAFVRAEWPALIDGESPSEIVEYSEVIRDDFGRNHDDDDNYRRRFESVRVGRYRR